MGKRTNTKSILRKHPLQISSANWTCECAIIWAEDQQRSQYIQVQECGHKITSEVSIYRCRNVGRRTNTKSIIRKHPLQRSSANSIYECARISAEEIQKKILRMHLLLIAMLKAHEQCRRCRAIFLHWFLIFTSWHYHASIYFL